MSHDNKTASTTIPPFQTKATSTHRLKDLLQHLNKVNKTRLQQQICLLQGHDCLLISSRHVTRRHSPRKRKQKGFNSSLQGSSGKEQNQYKTRPWCNSEVYSTALSPDSLGWAAQGSSAAEYFRVKRQRKILLEISTPAIRRAFGMRPARVRNFVLDSSRVFNACC